MKTKLKGSVRTGSKIFLFRVLGMLAVATGAVIAFIGTFFSCLCAFGPIITALGLTGIIAGFIVLDNLPIIIIGMALILLGLYLASRKECRTRK
jgi:hypothetical protein